MNTPDEKTTAIPQGIVIVEGTDLQHIHTGDGVEDFDALEEYAEEYDLPIRVED